MNTIDCSPKVFNMSSSRFPEGDKMSLRQGLGLALRSIRRARRLTQEDFTVVSSRTFVSSLERSQKSATLDKLEELSNVLNVHPLTLITLTCMLGESRELPDLQGQVLHEIAEITTLLREH